MITKEKIQNSIEARWRKRLIAYCGACIGLYVFVVLTAVINHKSLADSPGGLAFPGLVLLIPFFYEIVRYFMLFSRVENYEIYEVLLDRPTTSFWYRGCVYFTVGIDLKRGIGIFRKTKPIWSDHFLSKFKAWEYMNSKVQIAYDDEKDRMIVLGDEMDWRLTDE